MGTVKCIGILTSGGDAPGMNAAIRAEQERRSDPACGNRGNGHQLCGQTDYHHVYGRHRCNQPSLR